MTSFLRTFRFENPEWFLLLVPVVAIGLVSLRRARRDAVMYSSVALLKDLPKTLALRLKRFLYWFRLVGLGLIVVALARPRQGLEEFRVRTEGIAIQLCVDRSGSMQAMDFELGGKPVNRLDAVKDVFRKFVLGHGVLEGRPDDLIGLIAFGGFADSQCPLTLDHGALLDVLDGVEIPKPIRDSRGRVINEQLLNEEMATAIGDAVALAVDRLKDAEAKSKVIILLSDGENTAGIVEPTDAAQAAKSFGIKIYSIGVGSTGRAPFQAVDAFGRSVLVPQFVKLDEQTLKELAETTGGKYFNARDTAALEGVYADIDQLEKTRSERLLYTDYREFYHWFLLPGVAAVMLEFVLSCTRFRSLP